MQSNAVSALSPSYAESPTPVQLTLAASSPIGRFERLPKWLNCIPLVVQWLWLSLRYHSVSLPSAANPHITCGGMVGEGKLEYFECMGELARSVTAEYVAVPVTGETTIGIALERMRAMRLCFPVVAKPNLGWCGYGVRLISNVAALSKYLSAFPIGETFILQRYLPEAGEAGLFYARRPGEQFGRVIGITLRYFPKVAGDGYHTIGQLVAADPRLKRVEHNSLHESDYNPDAIPLPGETVRLATIGSTRIGGLYCDGGDHITQALDQAVDAIAQDMTEFYVGRFDVRYESLEQLRAGSGFTIMEVNGSGSESVHAWDPKYTIRESYRIIFAKQRLLFQISAANRRNGHKPIGLWKLARLHFQQQALINRYPLSN